MVRASQPNGSSKEPPPDEMKVRFFVTGSAAFFAAWLAVTYVREVPHEDYPRLGKGSLPVSAQVQPEIPEAPEVAIVMPEIEEEIPSGVALAD